MCYYYGAAESRPSPMNYKATDLPGNMCSHVTLAFMSINTETFELQTVINSYINDTGT